MNTLQLIKKSFVSFLTKVRFYSLSSFPHRSTGVH